MFQMMLAAIGPLLLTGAYAERLLWRPFVAFTFLWEIFVYYPVAHWVWGGGWLERMGVLDFAGGIVLHVCARGGAGDADPKRAAYAPTIRRRRRARRRL